MKKPSQTTGQCYLCDFPFSVAPGQVVYWHGICRKEGREKMTYPVSIPTPKPSPLPEPVLSIPQKPVDNTRTLFQKMLLYIFNLLKRIFKV